jgi:macrolide transport system ATP-binding/permease protein
MAELIRIQNLSVAYASRGLQLPVLTDLNLTVLRGEFLAIQGRSGSGKSTLFHTLGGFLPPDRGEIFIDGPSIYHLSPIDLARFRNRTLGFVFQQFHLLPRATVLENILLPSRYPSELAGVGTDLLARARELAEKVGLGEKLNKHPNELSGGEQQRVVIARALLLSPSLILADEPTGNLDSKNAENILQILEGLHAQGTTIVLITHDPAIAARCSRTIYLEDGRFSSEAEFAPQAPPAKRAVDRTTGSHSWTLVKTLLPLAFANIRRNKLRAVLTMIGVSVGIASVLAMVTFASFARKKILKGYEEMGVNTAVISGSPNYNRKATDNFDVLFHGFDWEKDLIPLHRFFPQIRLLSPMMGSYGNTVNYGGNTATGDILALGVGAEYTAITNRGLSLGRPFTPYHVENRSSVCLIGSELSTQLFKQESPLGRIIFVALGEGSPYPCRVLGVLNDQSSNKDWSKPNLEVLLPFTYFKSVTPYWYNDMRQFVVQFLSGTDVEVLTKYVKFFFEKKYGSGALFHIDSDSVMVAQMKKFIRLFTLMLTSLAAILLLVGGLGIHNLMMISITERLKEIGLRKALGATNRSIRLQFLFEAITLAVIAGFIGLIVGFSAYEGIIYGASRLVKSLTFEWIFDPTAFVLALFSLSLVAVLSGLLPALKAERLSVIEALRSE